MQTAEKREPVLGRRATQKRVREDTIIQAARDLMAQQGYEAMTMDDLATRAGISKPTLYQHFPSKEAIAVRAVVDLVHLGREYIVNLEPDLPALEKLRRAFRRVIQEKFENGKLSFGPAARAALVPVIRANPKYQEEFSELFQAICGIVEEAKTEGTVCAELPTKVAVQMFFSILRDGDHHEFIARGEITAAELADTVVAVLLDGMRKRP